MQSWAAAIRGDVGAVLQNRRTRSLIVVYFLLFAVVTTYQQTIPLFYSALGVPIAAYGFAKSVGNGLEAVASTPAGVLADRIDRPLVAIGAGSAIAGTLLLLPSASTALGLGALVVVLAVARLVGGVALTPLFDEQLGDGAEGLGWGLRDVGIYLGSAVGLAVAGVVVTRFGRVGTVFYALVPVVLLLVVFLAWTYRPSVGDVPTRSELVPELSLEAFRAVGEISRPRVLARFLAVDLFATLGMGMSFFLLPVYAVDIGLEPAAFLFVFGGSHVFAAPLSVAGGIATDRLSRKGLFVGNYAIEAVMLGVFALAGGPIVFGVGIALFVLQTGFEPAVLAYFFEQFDESESGRAWGIDGTVERGAGIVAPGLGGLAYGVDPHLPFAVGAVLLALGSVVASTLPR